MKRFPDEFADLLSPRGKRVLAGKDPKACNALVEERFFCALDLLTPAARTAGPKLLAKAFAPCMKEMSAPIPPADQSSFHSGMEKLPKVGRVLEADGQEAIDRAKDCGLMAMLQSGSYRAFVEAIAGRKLRGPDMLQVFCYRPGDYAGPHTDHHPEAPARVHGYIDTHLTFTTPGIDHQYLVYGRPLDHLDQVLPVQTSGAVTAYRLPFWHYVTPLVGRPKARRWLVLGTFLFD